MKKKAFAMMVAAALLLPLAACGKTAPVEDKVGEAVEAEIEEAAEAEVTEEPAKEDVVEAETVEEDGQNPVMNFVGVYGGDDFREALVEADGTENVKITVTRAASPWVHEETVMSGRFDTASLTVDFADAALTEYKYNSDGSVKEEKAGFTDGTGKAIFNKEDNTLTITGQLFSNEEETVFTWGASPVMKNITDPDHYKSVTDMDKAKIETEVAYNVRKAYLRADWNTLAGMIRYPITINETDIYDGEDFTEFMATQKVSDGSWKDMDEEDLLDMFVNGEGICMGSGQVWLNDPGYMTDEEPKLEIIAINGIVDRNAESDEAAADEEKDKEKTEEKTEEKQENESSNGSERPEREEDFYSSASVTVYDINGEKHKLYESSDGYWREEDGTTYSRISQEEFRLRDGDQLLKTYVWSEDEDDGGEEDFYSSPSVTVYDEDDNPHKLYEGSDGNWREEDGTTYIRISDTEYKLQGEEVYLYR